jgi:hypothetical protein
MEGFSPGAVIGPLFALWYVVVGIGGWVLWSRREKATPMERDAEMDKYAAGIRSILQAETGIPAEGNATRDTTTGEYKPATVEQLIKGAVVLTRCNGEYKPATVEGPSRSKQGMFELRFQSDGQVVHRALAQIKKPTAAVANPIGAQSAEHGVV